MFTNSSKWLISGCVLFSVLICVAGAITINWYKQSTECFKNRPPLQAFILTIDQSQQKLLIEQSQKFADKHGFKFEIAYYTPSGQEFLIDMTRTDTELTISNPSSVDLGVFYVYFYNYDCVQPTVASDISDLGNDLKSLLSEIPNATITEAR